MSERPWGHKLTVSIYVEGGRGRAEMAYECVASQLLVPHAAFIGVGVEEVRDRPIDQAAT